MEILDPTNKKNLKIKFKDVAGLHEAKVEISEFVDYLKNPTKYSVSVAKFFFHWKKYAIVDIRNIMWNHILTIFIIRILESLPWAEP